MKCFRIGVRCVPGCAWSAKLAALLATGLFALSAAAADNEHATLIREASLYSSPATSAERIAQVERGRDLVVLERKNADGNQTWMKIFVTLTQGENSRQVTGWLPATAVVTAATMNADQIIYGEAVNAEQEGERPRGRRGAAEDALRLYQRVAEYFPNSPLTGEATFRFADIRWQLDRAKAKGQAPVDEKLMQAVIQKYPGSKWADLAAYDLLENKMCPEWRGLADCPLKESTAYELYAREHPRSPKAAEALYNAAWRQAALADIFRIQGQPASSTAARNRAMALTQELASQLQPEGKTRAASLLYKLQQNISVYGLSQ